MYQEIGNVPGNRNIGGNTANMPGNILGNSANTHANILGTLILLIHSYSRTS